jgi:membrane protease YdiL (CAAX protease family)
VQPDLMETTPAPLNAGRPRRWAEGVLFVAIWIGLGWALALDANAYLLLGIPLTLVFQLFVRREPLRSLWVREAPPFRRGWLIPAVLLAILPAISLNEALGRRDWVVCGWLVAALVGAIAAGYALVHLRRESLRPFLLCQLTAGTIGISLMIAVRLAMRMAGTIPREPLPLVGLHDFLLYFPVCFVLEEVSFRGALDSHLHHAGERFRFTSALLGSALWGVWHLPTLPAESQSLQTALVLAVTHSLIGVPLAIYWRKSGNLAVPAFAHAMIDGVRNGLRLMGG